MHSRACWDEAAGSVDAHRTTPGMTERVCRSRVAASTTGLAEVGTEDRKVRSVDARLRRRRKLAPARSNSAALSITLIVFDTAPCPPTRNCLLAANVPPPRGPCFAVDALLCRRRPASPSTPCFAVDALLRRRRPASPSTPCFAVDALLRRRRPASPSTPCFAVDALLRHRSRAFPAY
jgi:hypothetical protein